MLDRSDAREFHRHVTAILNAIARKLEQIAFSQEDLIGEQIEDSYLHLQKVIYKYKAAAGALNSRSHFDHAVNLGLEVLYELRNDDGIRVLERIKVRLPRLRTSAQYVFLHPELLEVSSIEIGVVLDRLLDSFMAARDEAPFLTSHEQSPDFSSLQSVQNSIPSQRIAPAQFDIVDGRLTVIDQQANHKAGSSDLIEESLDSLLNMSKNICDSLRSSNADRRILDQFLKLDEVLKSKKNIIRLGLENINCRLVAASCSDELPDILNAQIEGFSSGLGMYVAQFTEWQSFVQNAAEATINEVSENALSAFVADLRVEIAKNSEFIDESVPATINFLNQMIADPSRTSKRAIFAFIRTVENLIIRSFTFAIDTVTMTANKTSEKFSDSASTALARGVVAVSLVASAGLLPISANLKGSEWMETAYHVVLKQVAPMLGLV